MSQMPQTITITLIAAGSDSYRARLVGYTVGEQGGYGSAWTLAMADIASRDSNAAAVLVALATALIERVGG